ncbi:MAG: type II toxin-antitoxin system RelE family toxin [Methylococcales bacterium]
MAWRIVYLPAAERDLAGLDAETRRRVLKFIDQRIASLENPRLIGEPLHGRTLGNFWKYRVGDYRIICDIQDKEVRVVVVKIGNRREVYR